MIRRILIVGGRVHDVGYRPFLLGLAESVGLERFFADNVFEGDRQAVEVLVDGPEEVLERFLELVGERRPEGAEVDEVRIEEYGGRVMEIESYYRYLTATQLSKIASYGRFMLEKQDQMLEKQDQMLEVIREEGQKTREFLGEKIDLLRIDLREYMRQNLEEIRRELAEIKDALRGAGIM